MLFVGMCHDHDLELRLTKPGSSAVRAVGTQLLYDIFECPDQDCCFDNWSFKTTTLKSSSVDIIRAAIADLNGATNRLSNVLKTTPRNIKRDEIV